MFFLFYSFFAFSETSCYKAARDFGIKLHNDKEYQKAIEQFGIASRCKDIPKDNDIGSWINACNEGLKSVQQTTSIKQEDKPSKTGLDEKQASTLKKTKDNPKVNITTLVKEGDMYYYGDTINPINYQKAHDCYLKAANQGNPYAQFAVGRMCFQGKWVQQDGNEAYKWFLSSSNQGDAQGHFGLGIIIAEGKVVQQDYDKAYELLLKSADKEYAQAQYWLGYIHEIGLYNITQDYSKAYEWYLKSANQENKNAQYCLGNYYYYGKDDIPQSYEKSYENDKVGQVEKILRINGKESDFLIKNKFYFVKFFYFL
jgi:TPR repeat protein